MKYKAIILDLQGTLFDSISQLLPGAEELLAFAKGKGLKLGVITNGSYSDTIIKHLKLDQYLDEIKVVSMSKTPDEFEDLIKSFGAKPEESIAIGDLVGQEIRCMNLLGGTTIWIHRGHPGVPSVNEYEHPDYAVADLVEAKGVLENLLAEEA